MDDRSYFYGLVARPYLPGSTQPDGEVLYEQFDDWTEVDGTEVRAIVVYSEELSEAQCRHYSLEPLDNDAVTNR